jgi:hypothetical protein
MFLTGFVVWVFSSFIGGLLIGAFLGFNELDDDIEEVDGEISHG